MPGAPNRPPEVSPPPPPPSPAGESPELRLLRRLSPARVALHLDLWKAGPPREFVEPLAKAEALYHAGDIVGAETALDQLAVRLAEPRWPTLPVPFRSLRVEIPPPQPPHYDPEFSLPPAEKDARKARRHAESQLALAKASVEWARAHAVPSGDLAEGVVRAEAALDGAAPAEAFWPQIDALWASVRERVPMPTLPQGHAPGAPAEAPAGGS
jgi:hypothetical protein